MAGEHGSSPPVAKSSSKQISYEDWWTCKKEKEGHLQKGVPQMHTCWAAEIIGPPGATNRAEHGEEHPECLRMWWVSFVLFSLHHGDMNANNGAAPGPEMAHPPE